jgi:HK97 gp10 family phage protein
MAEVRVSGLDELKSFMDKLPQKIGESIDDIMGVAAAMIETDAKRIVPVRTGTLQRSIQTEHLGFKQWVVGSKVFYAGYVEFGTSRSHARPYLRPALENVKPKIDKAIIDVLEEYFERGY